MEHTTANYSNITSSPPLENNGDNDHTSEGTSVNVIISEIAVRNVYVSIGTFGFFGNLLVMVIMTFYTNAADKVSIFSLTVAGCGLLIL
jgi:hypothetical protein